MRIAYLVNQYPKISHAFIRREILAVEEHGCEVIRYSIRRTRDQLPDPLDRAEAARTQAILDSGWGGLISSLVSTALRRPLSFWRALCLSVRVGRHSDRGILRHVVYLAEACVLIRWFARDGIEHVHAHFGTNSTTVAMLGHELGGPSYSFTAHGSQEVDKAHLLGLGDKIARAVFVVAVSSYVRSQLLRRCKFRLWPKIKVLHCGVDDAFLKKEPAPIPNTRQLVSVGRLSEEKGQRLLIEAVAQLRREGRTLTLVLIGDGPLRDELKSAIAKHGLADSVTLAGSANGDGIRHALDAGCAFVLPSFAEGLPVVIMEAFARARPTLSTFIGGIPELVVPGRNGWLVPAGSVEALANGLRQILDSPLAQLSAMGERGREDVREKHDINAIARTMIGYFRRAIEETSSSIGDAGIPSRDM
jgi:colanic acid/amylovoran biosynthesis glycosyltransferase